MSPLANAAITLKTTRHECPRVRCWLVACLLLPLAGCVELGDAFGSGDESHTFHAEAFTATYTKDGSPWLTLVLDGPGDRLDSDLVLRPAYRVREARAAPWPAISVPEFLAFSARMGNPSTENFAATRQPMLLDEGTALRYAFSPAFLANPNVQYLMMDAELGAVTYRAFYPYHALEADQDR